MFGLIGHSKSFDAARRNALDLGLDFIADGDLDVWCMAPPQLVEHVEVTSPVGTTIEGAYIDSCFVPLRRDGDVLSHPAAWYHSMPQGRASSEGGMGLPQQSSVLTTDCFSEFEFESSMLTT